MNILKDDQLVAIALSYTDSVGNPAAAPQAAPIWSSSDETVGTVSDNGDGSATVTAVGPLGSFQAQVSVTMDDGGIITGVAEFQVVADSASTITLTVGTPADKVAAPAPVADPVVDPAPVADPVVDPAP
jgi:hypothetical protein